MFVWDSPSELRSSLCKKTIGKDSSEACAISSQKLRSLLSFSVRYDVTQ
jgi:hypothetical protein